MKEKDRQVEQEYLNTTLAILSQNIKDVEVDFEENQKLFDEENQKYLNAMKDMDLNTLSEETELAVANMQVALEQKVALVNKLKAECEIYKKMLNSPYFAKINLVPSDTQKEEKYYIGMHTLNDSENNFVILDWRSPIASVFYDYQVGKAKIFADNLNPLDVDLVGKRQFKIENGKLVYFFDTNIAIEDELLQDALGQNSSNSMKSIVQTIQAEQNKIIRSPEGVDLVVNGVAGSGKTAIALHRIAYLLYKLKGKLTSDSVVVVSQNNAFSSYISQVLPELAEQDVAKIILDVLCQKNLAKIADIEMKYEQIDRVINNEEQKNVWRQKTSLEFFEELDNYCKNVISQMFKPKSFMVMGVIIPEEKLRKLYFEMYAEQSMFTRICWMSEALVEDYFYNVKSSSATKRLKIEIFEKLFSFVQEKKPVSLYLKFLTDNNMKMSLRGNRIKNEDAYAIWYIRMYVLGYKANTFVKHLVVDEMQEYSALQIKILNMLYPCTKTYLGDYLQNIEKESAKKTINNFAKISGATINFVELNKSYRSTMQITKFFAFLSDNKDIAYVHRSGDEVGFVKYDLVEEIACIKKLIKQNSKFATIAIITKTNKQAKELYRKLRTEIRNVSVVLNNQDVLRSKISIMSAYNSKGLEFDYVLVYDASVDNYRTDNDNNLLFICASRAMHKLDVLTTSEFCDKIVKYRKDNNI